MITQQNHIDKKLRLQPLTHHQTIVKINIMVKNYVKSPKWDGILVKKNPELVTFSHGESIRSTHSVTLLGLSISRISIYSKIFK